MSIEQASHFIASYNFVFSFALRKRYYLDKQIYKQDA